MNKFCLWWVRAKMNRFCLWWVRAKINKFCLWIVRAKMNKFCLSWVGAKMNKFCLSWVRNKMNKWWVRTVCGNEWQHFKHCIMYYCFILCQVKMFFIKIFFALFINILLPHILYLFSIILKIKIFYS